MDEELTFGQTLKNSDITTMDEQPVLAAEQKEVDKLRGFGVFSVDDAQEGYLETKRCGWRSTRSTAT